MNSIKTSIHAALAAIFILTVAFAPTAQADCGASHASAKVKADIVDTAAAAGTFNTLIAAAKAAGLVDALKGDGPLTVFAPTDDAFAALPKGTVESLLKPENKDQLVAILTYHVVSGSIYAKDALAAGKAETLQGGMVTIALKDGQAQINDANIVATDIEASNGVIHVIDKVILPPAKDDGHASAQTSSSSGCSRTAAKVEL